MMAPSGGGGGGSSTSRIAAIAQGHAEEDLTQVSFKDTAFLQMFGLHEHNALQYFSLSPQFYDKSCINERIIMQTRFNELQAAQLDAKSMTGVEYDLGYFSYQPSLFVVNKYYRSSPTRRDLQAVYYIVEGSIYQAPDLFSIVSNRVLTSLHHIQSAFTSISEEAKFSPALGSRWDRDLRQMTARHRARIRQRTRESQLRHDSGMDVDESGADDGTSSSECSSEDEDDDSDAVADESTRDENQQLNAGSGAVVGPDTRHTTDQSMKDDEVEVGDFAFPKTFDGQQRAVEFTMNVDMVLRRVKANAGILGQDLDEAKKQKKAAAAAAVAANKPLTIEQIQIAAKARIEAAAAAAAAAATAAAAAAAATAAVPARKYEASDVSSRLLKRKKRGSTYDRNNSSPYTSFGSPYPLTSPSPSLPNRSAVSSPALTPSLRRKPVQ